MNDDDDVCLYPAVRDGKSGLVMVLTELIGGIPRRSLPIAVRAFLTFPPDIDTNEVHAIEESLANRIGAAGGCWVGHFLSAGELRAVGYLPTVPDAATQAAWRQRWTDVAFETDQDWSLFATLLAPDPDELAASGDLGVVAELMQLGDNPTKPRPIDHQVEFSDHRQAGPFLDMMRGEGFDVVGLWHEPGSVGYQLTRLDEIGHPPGGVLEIVRQLRIKVRRAGGEHIGWGSPLTKPRIGLRGLLPRRNRTR